ncbi:hypothetical protein EDB80DRAFT_869715 [Ilyonectria destructans]|nr:hypothetical protein EDB80DRAFT_869715 [Ilyonectria destructans]
MCLTIVHHQSELEIRSPAVINPFSGNKYFNPYQTIIEECHYGGAIGENFCTFHGDSASCIKNEWQICSAEDGETCLEWQTFHVVSPSKDESFLSKMGKPLLPLDDRHVCSDRHASYIKLRRDFWEAGTQVQWWTEQLDVCSKKLAVQREASCDDGYLLMCLKEARKQLQDYIDELLTLTQIWKMYATDYKMEPCPADGFDFDTFAEFFQASPENGVQIIPYQLLLDTDPERSPINYRG